MNRRVPDPCRRERARLESKPGSRGLLKVLRRPPRATDDGGRAVVPRRAGGPLFGPGYLALLLVVTALVASAFVFHLSVRYEGIRLGYETSKAQAVRTRMLLERRELRLELATLKSPEQIESEARERLGMVAPDNDRIVPIRPRRTVAASGGAH